MIAGIISDKYEKQNMRIKPQVCCVMSLLAIPTSMTCFLVHDNFTISMTFLFLEYLLAEGWNSPAISMIQQVVDPSVKGVAISIYLFSVTIAGTIASVVVGAVSTSLHT
jgi:dipeptide/tripeptide permease